jgi:hypothetical protein
MISIIYPEKSILLIESGEFLGSKRSRTMAVSAVFASKVNMSAITL